MMLPDNIATKPSKKDESQSSSSHKTSSMRPPEQALKCPRCDSPNTKFCYFNNYSLTQPRHFCKTCRRYWTKGGALRNVPIGGGCRKNKKTGPSSRPISTNPNDPAALHFFDGLPPAMDFNFPTLHSSTTGVYNQFSTPIASAPCFGLDPSANGSGFNLPLSSIESLSSINQDLHWKLQQQRLAMLLGGENQKESSVSLVPVENHSEKAQPILFENLEISRKDSGRGELSTEWFFGNSNNYGGAVNGLSTNSSSTENIENGGNWNGIQAWGNFNQYSSLP